MSQTKTWHQLFSEHDHIRLALSLREPSSSRAKVRGYGDDEIILAGGSALSKRQAKREKDVFEPKLVVLTPQKHQSPEDFQALCENCREQYPEARFLGFGPAGWSEPKEGLFSSRVWKLAELSSRANLEPIPEEIASEETVVLSYAPDTSSEALEEAVASYLGRRSEQPRATFVPLPLGIGDRVPLAGVTTAGSMDMMVISVLRHLLPGSVRVRASWAALGWKVAQMSLLHGADTLGGWMAAESLLYGANQRAAARVPLKELQQGVAEAGRELEPHAEEAGSPA